MKIENLKDLESFLKLCRKYKISTASASGFTFCFREQEEKLNSEQPKEEIKENQLTDEELLFWSSSAGE